MALIRYRDLSMLYRRRKRMSEWAQQQGRQAALEMVQATVDAVRLEMASELEWQLTLGQTTRYAEAASEPLRTAAVRVWRLGFYDASDRRPSRSDGAEDAARRLVAGAVDRLAEMVHGRALDGYRSALQDGADRGRALRSASLRLRTFDGGSLIASGVAEFDMSLSPDVAEAFFYATANSFSPTATADSLLQFYLDRDDPEARDKLLDKAYDAADARGLEGFDDYLSYMCGQWIPGLSGPPPEWNPEWGPDPHDFLPEWSERTGVPLTPNVAEEDGPDPEREWSVLADTVGRESAVYLMNEGLLEAFKQEGAAVKMWVSTLDERVREEHERMHGECIPVWDNFQLTDNGFDYFSLPVPGVCAPGYDCPPSQIYNCRCTMVAGESCEELQALFDSLSEDQITVAAESTSAPPVGYRPGFGMAGSMSDWADAGYVEPGTPWSWTSDPRSPSLRDSDWRRAIREAFPQWSNRSSYPDRIMGSLYEYARGKTDWMQNWLRNGWRPHNTFERARLGQVIKDVWSMFDSARAPAPVQVWRGLNVEDALGFTLTDEERANPVGLEWTDWGFSSTTAHYAIADNFHDPFETGNVILEFVVPEGFPAVAIATLQDYFDDLPRGVSVPYEESEVLLPPGTQFRVTGRREQGDPPIVVWEVEVSINEEAPSRQDGMKFEGWSGFNEDSFDSVIYESTYVDEDDIYDILDQDGSHVPERYDGSF